jgi:glutamine amidotransferase
MSGRVTIVDYGIGNIFSVARAFLHCGAKVEITDKPSEIRNASRLVLPGVGAFSNGMHGLSQRELIDVLKEFSASGRPMLGICLGMQMLFSESSEFGTHSGLDIIEGKILPMCHQVKDGVPLKIPHIGWSGLGATAEGADWKGTIFKKINPSDFVYFVHSFMAVPEKNQHQLAVTEYGDIKICAAVSKDNVYGCQFHPEKSGSVGLKIIGGFLEC